MLTRFDARTVLQRCRIPVDSDYHALPSDQVEALLAEADRVKYRKPKNANGSRARYFHAYLLRRARREED